MNCPRCTSPVTATDHPRPIAPELWSPSLTLAGTRIFIKWHTSIESAREHAEQIRSALRGIR